MIDIDKERLISDNIGIVYKIARNFFDKYNLESRGLILDDLVSVGKIVMVENLEKFDEAKGYSFSTYSYCLIQKRILAYIKEVFSSQKIYVNYDDVCFVDEEEEGSITFLDVTPDINIKNIEDQLLESELRALIASYSGKLSKIELTILFERILDEELSQKEIARKFNVGQQYVSYIETSLKKRMKSMLFKYN